MKRFHDWSIRNKLRGLFFVMPVVTALTMALPMGVFDFLGLRRSMTTDLEQIGRRDNQLRDHRERLEQEVASRTGELLAANEQPRRAEEKYRAIFEDASQHHTKSGTWFWSKSKGISHQRGRK